MGVKYVMGRGIRYLVAALLSAIVTVEFETVALVETLLKREATTLPAGCCVCETGLGSLSLAGGRDAGRRAGRLHGRLGWCRFAAGC